MLAGGINQAGLAMFLVRLRHNNDSSRLHRSCNLERSCLNRLKNVADSRFRDAITVNQVN